MQVPDRWWNKFKDVELPPDHPKLQPKYLQHTRAAFAMCENIDWNVGRLLAKLDELKLAENTIVLYFCDNGPNGDPSGPAVRGLFYRMRQVPHSAPLMSLNFQG